MLASEVKKLKAEIRKHNKFWRQVLGLSSWDGLLKYEDLCDDSPTTAARCSCDWRYKHYTITFYLDSFKNETPLNREYTIIHELCHVKVNEMAQKESQESRDHEERVVTELAWAYYWTKEAGEKLGRKKK